MKIFFLIFLIGQKLISNIVTADITTIDTTDKLADLYFQTHNDISTVINHLTEFSKLLNNTSIHPKTILDLGCGPGRDINFFVKQGFKCSGIDLSKETLTIAQKNCPDSEFFMMDMIDLQFQTNSFAGLWSCGSFYHLTKEEGNRALKEFNRVLKPGGIFFLAVKKGQKEEFENRKEYYELPKFYSFYQEEEILNLLKSNGFKILYYNIEYKQYTWINIFSTI